MNSASVFQGASARTTNTVGSAVNRAIGLNWSSVYAGLRCSTLSASGRIEIDDRLSSTV
jgi:hypothetical protein